MNIKLMQVGEIGTNCYLLEDEDTRSAAIIDPGGEARGILGQAKAVVFFILVVGLGLLQLRMTRSKEVQQ